MTGYIKTDIDFDGLQKDLDAAKSLSEAGRIETSKQVLKSMADKLKEEAQDG
tara:strand:- start:225 stop:380 length:156 start_codon:yes stop_codon:yes gene_type:complete